MQENTVQIEESTVPPTRGVKLELTWGVILGVGLALIQLVSFRIVPQPPDFEIHLGYSLLASAMDLLVFVLCMRIPMLRHRAELSGFIDYGQCVKSGVLTALFGGILLSILTYLTLLFIYPDLLRNNMLTFVTNLITDMGGIDPRLISNGTFDGILHLHRQLFSPGVVAISSAFSSILKGIILTLLVALTVRRKPSPTV